MNMLDMYGVVNANMVNVRTYIRHVKIASHNTISANIGDLCNVLCTFATKRRALERISPCAKGYSVFYTIVKINF